MNDNTVTKFTVGKAVKFLLTVAFVVAVGTLLLDLVVPGHLGPAMRMTLYAGAGLSMFLAAVILLNRHMSSMQMRDYEDRQRQEPNPVDQVDGVLAHAVDEIRQDLADDVEDIKSGRITRAQVYTALAVLGGMVTLYQGIVYEKFSLSATWIGIPVWIWAAVAVILVFVIGSQTSWFSDRQFKTPGWFFAIVILALPLSIVLGLNFTEPTELGGKTPHELAMSQGYQYNYLQTRGGYWYYQSFYTSGSSSTSSGGSSSGGGSVDCGKNCGYAILAIAVIVLVLIMLIASGLVAHFWFFSASVLFAIALVIAIQAIRYRPYKRPAREVWRY